MRPVLWIGISLIIAIPVILLCVRSRNVQPLPDRTHVVFIGASIGQAWNLGQWSVRVNEPRFAVESLAEWQFDKTRAVEAVMRRPSMKFELSRTYLKSIFQPPAKPDVVILKECSAYFPGPIATYQESIRRWTTRLEEQQIRVALATVVPVTAYRAARDPGKQEGLLAFNRWLREFAQQRGYQLIDLEGALRDKHSVSYLRDDLAAPDGSHLTGHAYQILDQVLRDALRGAVTTSKGNLE